MTSLTKKDKAANKPGDRRRDIQTRLLRAQQQLKQSDLSAVIIVSGMEGAGKGEVVTRISEWLDIRGLQTAAFWTETDEQRLRPEYWRFWRELPPRGKISIMFGSWYSSPLLKRLFGEMSQSDFERQLAYINEFENMLVNDGITVVKFWFHLTKDMVKERVEEDTPIFELKLEKFPELNQYLARYDEFADLSGQALEKTSTPLSPWHVIDASDRDYRDLTMGQILANSFQDAVPSSDNTQATDNTAVTETNACQDLLGNIDLGRSLDSDTYNELLNEYQLKLSRLAWQAHYQKKSVVIVFEGWDAAGKGGVIRRISRAIDARLYKAISVEAPSDEEKNHHYLWRFWRHVPMAGYMTFYDRSWYGRVLVERVEDFARDDEWKRAYGEIRHFEEQLTNAGTIVLKFWLHISKDEQLKRFYDRQNKPWKKHKITDDDWRNREKWPEYEEAVNEMLNRTSTANAPWQVIPAEDKKHARIETLRILCNTIESNLDTTLVCGGPANNPVRKK